jgi:hypothetical protein
MERVKMRRAEAMRGRRRPGRVTRQKVFQGVAPEMRAVPWPRRTVRRRRVTSF